MPKITPFLWFDRNAEEAARFYVSVFKNSRITGVTHYQENSSQPKGTVMTVSFELEGQKFMALNGGPAFKFNEAISLHVGCGTQKEIDELWDKLTEGGQEVQCGWIKDRFGLSWQIVPVALVEMLSGMDPVRAARVTQAMMRMVKLDIATLRKAYDG